jgi:hypothetical protein
MREGNENLVVQMREGDEELLHQIKEGNENLVMQMREGNEKCSQQMRDIFDKTTPLYVFFCCRDLGCNGQFQSPTIIMYRAISNKALESLSYCFLGVDFRSELDR